MPVSAEELVRLLAILAEEENMKVCHNGREKSVRFKRHFRHWPNIMQALLLVEQWQIQGGRIGRSPPPPPPFLGPFLFCFAFHPGGRSGRRTVPLLYPINVNDGKKKMCRSPPPPPPPRWATFFRPGVASQLLDSRPSLFTYPGFATVEGFRADNICAVPSRTDSPSRKRGGYRKILD